MTRELIVRLKVSDDNIDTRGNWRVEDWLKKPSKLREDFVDFLADFLVEVSDVRGHEPSAQPCICQSCTLCLGDMY